MTERRLSAEDIERLRAWLEQTPTDLVRGLRVYGRMDEIDQIDLVEHLAFLGGDATYWHGELADCMSGRYATIQQLLDDWFGVAIAEALTKTAERAADALRTLREKAEFWERAASAEAAHRRDHQKIIVAYLRRVAARQSISYERDVIDEAADAIEDNVENVAQCPFACPHNDQCTLEVGHDGGHNFRGCDCNDPVTPPCDRCGKRLSADDMEHAIAGDGWNLYLCEHCSHAERMHDR